MSVCVCLLKIKLKNQYDFLVLCVCIVGFFSPLYCCIYCLDAGQRAGILWCRINWNMFRVFICWALVSHIVSVELNAAHWSIFLYCGESGNTLLPLILPLCLSLVHCVYVLQSRWVSYCKNMNKFTAKTRSILCDGGGGNALLKQTILISQRHWK